MQRSVRPHPSHAVSIANSFNCHPDTSHRPTSQSRAPRRLLGLSRYKFCLLDLRRLFNFTVHSTDISSSVLSKIEYIRKPKKCKSYGDKRTLAYTLLQDYYLSCFRCSVACVAGRLLVVLVCRPKAKPHRTTI